MCTTFCLGHPHVHPRYKDIMDTDLETQHDFFENYDIFVCHYVVDSMSLTFPTKLQLMKYQSQDHPVITLGELQCRKLEGRDYWSMK